MRYLAILGKNPYLSLAELLSVYPKIKIITRTDKAVVFESAQTVEIDKLGGIPKLASCFAKATKDKESEIIINELKKLPKDKKIFFGLSFYDSKQNNSLGKNIKQALKNKGYKARWVTSKEPALSSVIIKTNKLLRRGGDFCVFKNWIAKTAAVQDFSDYEFRDMKRPARDLVSGMTPPKLAKMLINLGGKQKEILDPFCGSGTFLGEAAFLGFKNIYGSDISEKAVRDSKKNLEWLKEKYNFKADVKITKCDIKNIAECWRKKFDFIVTEPYLGPPIRGKLDLEQAKKLQKELNKKYEDYLAGLSSVLEKNGTLVLIVPIILSIGTILGITIGIKENGFKIINPLPKKIYDKPTIIYSRQGQKIGREIYILRKF